MDDWVVELVGIAIFALALTMVSLLANICWMRILKTADGFGFWAASLLTLPAISASYGLVNFHFIDPCPYVPPVCNAENCFAFVGSCDADVSRFVDLYIWVLAFPILSLCFAIPVTTWFVSRQKMK